ncbi:retrovirus-related Pol polyprotein from transposon 17.6 [Trichonephila clavipes]|nr:retrovirus-related Pol polyprotein from transposon 17.6 [Trichonephila clavipes]
MQISAENLQEELDLRHVENRQIKKELEKLIQDYKPEKTASTDVTMRIILKDEEPVCQHPRRLAFTERQEVNKQIEEWLNEGIIRPSSAEYASPIVMVKKKDGSSRMCIDYRKLNQKLVKDKFPLPIIEDVLDTLQEAKVYSTLDLRNGFFHVDVDEDCRNYTSFVVPDGQFEFNKVPFRLSTSPGVFQCYVSSIFRDLTRKGIVISYLDDLVIPAKNEQEGHIVESGTIKPSPTKTLAVRKFPEPTTIKQVQSFLGLTGYFRKYIKDYSKIAKPLSDLTRKENLFVFGIQQKEAFEKLKKIMSEGPILNLYKYGRKTELHTDACKQGYGAILLQEAEDGKLHPVYYMSKKTNTAEEKYDSYELEVLAIINALKKFRVYLLGQHFKIVTDCSAFQKTMQKKELITRIARWALQLEEFDYEIEHRAGSRMKHIDALSRYPVMMVCNDTLTSKLKNAQEEDDNIQTLKSLLEKQESEEFFERNGILYKYLNGRELIVTPKAMQAELIKLIHENANKKTGKKEGFLNPISKESIPLSTYHVDFIGPLPSTNKSYQHIFTVVDAFTKFTWLYPVKTVSAESALEKLKQQQKTFGNPIRIISDRGSAFTSKLFNDYCDEENIQHLQIATGVPRGNGQVERIHRTLIPVLIKLSLDDSTKCAARRLNVSRSVVQRLWDQYQSENSVSRRPVPGRPRATTPAEDRFLALSARRRRTTTVPQLVADHFQASGRRIFATTVRNRLHNAGLYARRPVVCVPLNGRQRRNRLCWAREHVSWTQQQWASVLFTDESRFTMESDSGRLLIWREQRTRYHQSNTVERHSYRGGGILVWAGISLGGHTDLHVFHGGTVTGLRYRDEILDPYVRPYAAAIGNDFILMDDNARPHRARIVEEYLEDHGLERMEWPARSPDLNPIEHLWDYLGREVAALNPPPRSLHELKQGLLCVWSSLPIPVSDSLVNSMGNRCRQCIQVRGGHIPY